MRRLRNFPSSGRERVSGAGVIGLLIVVVIMMVLTLIYFRPDEYTGKGAPETYIDRAGKSACDADRVSAKTKISMMQINSPGAVISIKLLEKTGVLPPKCPGGGDYVYQNGELYCTKHFPPPEPPAVEGVTATSSTQGLATGSESTSPTLGTAPASAAPPATAM